jgi:hypothetical protein
VAARTIVTSTHRRAILGSPDHGGTGWVTLTVACLTGATAQGSAARDCHESEAAGPPAKKARKSPGKFTERIHAFAD